MDSSTSISIPLSEARQAATDGWKDSPDGSAPISSANGLVRNGWRRAGGKKSIGRWLVATGRRPNEGGACSQTQTETLPGSSRNHRRGSIQDQSRELLVMSIAQTQQAPVNSSVDFWNAVLVPKFSKFRHILVGGLSL